MKIRYKMTSLLACKMVYIFLPNIRTRPLRSVRFGSVRKCHVRRTSVWFGGSATALLSLPSLFILLFLSLSVSFALLCHSIHLTFYFSFLHFKKNKSFLDRNHLNILSSPKCHRLPLTILLSLASVILPCLFPFSTYWVYNHKIYSFIFCHHIYINYIAF